MNKIEMNSIISDAVADWAVKDDQPRRPTYLEDTFVRIYEMAYWRGFLRGKLDALPAKDLTEVAFQKADKIFNGNVESKYEVTRFELANYILWGMNYAESVSKDS